jgi:hypothetical protein
MDLNFHTSFLKYFFKEHLTTHKMMYLFIFRKRRNCNTTFEEPLGAFCQIPDQNRRPNTGQCAKFSLPPPILKVP